MKLHHITIDRKSLGEEVVYKYGDSNAGFRELIQNAKDAILDYRLTHPGYLGTITVNIYPNLAEVTDDGTGMNVTEVDEFLLKMYGTSKNRDVRDRAGIFGRGFFAIFKDAAEVFVLTKTEHSPRMYLRIYPHENWFIAEELTLSELPEKVLPYVRKYGAHGSTILCFSRAGFAIDAIHTYLSEVCQFFDIPLFLNGMRINKSFEQAVLERGCRAIVTFNKFGVEGALGYKANDNMIQTFVHRIKVLNLISPESGVNGYINYDRLEVTPSRDALVQNENYNTFIRVLTEMCHAVLKKLSENPTPDDFQRLLDFAYSTMDPQILTNLSIFQIVGENKTSLKEILKRAKQKRIIFFADQRTFIADRLKKRGYIVIHELSPRLKEMLIKAIREYGMTIADVISPLAKKLAGVLEPRRIVPFYELSPSERTILDIIQGLVSERNLRVEIMEGDSFDDAEHVPGVIRLQRHSELLHLASQATAYPFLVKVLLLPLIAHEAAHEAVGDIHDESFYEIYEMILKEMHKQLFLDFFSKSSL
ncbi:MAG: ATP-binding protein [Candidatus Helarchaeota archaeon]